MNSTLKQLILVSSVSAVLVSAAIIAPAQSSKKAAPVAYAKVQAIFDKNCIGCHRGPKPRAMMNLETYKGVMKGNDDGSVVTPGKPDVSLLYKVVAGTARKHMPPGPKSLDKADVAAIGAWIKAGAKPK
ncbi:MAG: c-type cytochrome [Fimbriimonas sp.]|nr:c-type cytochrome [Fimbriimonas sp.]